MSDLLRVQYYASPLGRMLLCSDGAALCGLYFDGQRYCIGVEDYACGNDSVTERTCAWLDIYFSGQKPDFTPPLRPVGTPFRRAVWELLLTLPYGETVSYGELACAVANHLGVPSMSAQAVGGAVGHNPISLIIPCHRIVGARGELIGYAGGMERKRALLSLEGVASCR